MNYCIFAGRKTKQIHVFNVSISYHPLVTAKYYIIYIDCGADGSCLLRDQFNDIIFSYRYSTDTPLISDSFRRKTWWMFGDILTIIVRFISIGVFEGRSIGLMEYWSVGQSRTICDNIYHFIRFPFADFFILTEELGSWRLWSSGIILPLQMTK